MLNFDLSDLRLFLAVVKTGSVSRASEEVNLAVSSASIRLKEFERRTGVSLFQRQSKGMKPTEAGLLAENFAKRFLHEAADFEDAMKSFSQKRDRLRIATLPNALAAGLPEDLSLFMEAYPTIKFSLNPYQRGLPMLEKIEAGEEDVGITSWPGAFRGLVNLPYLSMRLKVFFGSGSDLAEKWKDREDLSLQDLINGVWVGLTEEHALQKMIERCIKDEAVDLIPKFRMANYFDAFKLAAEGVGFAILPKAPLNVTGITGLPIKEDWALLETRFWFKESNYRKNSSLRNFIDFLVKTHT